MKPTKKKKDSPSKQTGLDEHIIKTWIKPLNDTPQSPLQKTTFTTEAKRKPQRKTTINISRKGSIVKERCRQLTEIALELFPERRISREDLTFLVKTYIGGNRGTVRSYMGFNGRVVHGKSRSRVVGIRRKGYLEIFGFMHKVNVDTWIIHAQKTLLPPATPPHNNDEGLISSKKKISLSQRVNE